MTFFEDPDYTGKAPIHVANAIKNLKDFGKTSIMPSSKRYEINIKKITTETHFVNKYGKKITFDSGYLLSHKSKDLFYEILNDIKALPGRIYLPITKGEIYWVIPTSSEKELAEFIEKYSLESPIESVTPPKKEDKELDFKVGDIVLAHWLYDNRTERNAMARIKKISPDKINVISIEDKIYTEDGISAEYKAGSSYFIPIPFTSKTYIEKVAHESSDMFNVGDIVTAHFIYDSKNYSIPAVVIKKLDNKYWVKLLSSEAPFNEGDKIFTPRPFTEKAYLEFKYGEYVAGTKREDILEREGLLESEFKVGETVDVHWKEEIKGDITAKGEIKSIKDNMYHMTLLEEPDSTLFAKGETISIAKKGAPGYRDSDYITHIKVPVDDFKVGDVGIAHWIFVDTPRDVKVIINEVFPTGYRVKVYEDITYGDIKYSKDEIFDIHRPFTDKEYIKKLPDKKVVSSVSPDDVPFYVGEIAEAHWNIKGEHVYGDVKITKVERMSIQFETVKDIIGSHYLAGTFRFDYPFKDGNYIVHKITSAPIFKVGDKVVAHWTADGNLTSKENEICIVDTVVKTVGESYYDVELLTDPPSSYINSDMYHKGDSKSIPRLGSKAWNEQNKLEYKTKLTMPDIKDLPKIESFEVGEHVTAHWIIDGVDKSAKVKITSRRIADGQIDFELLEPIALGSSVPYKIGTSFHFSYPFVANKFLTRGFKPIAVAYDFFEGEIVNGHWMNLGIKREGKVKITKITDEKISIETISDNVFPDYTLPKGSKLVFHLPFTEDAYLEKIVSSDSVSKSSIKPRPSIIDYIPFKPKPKTEKILTPDEISTYIDVLAKSGIDDILDMFKKPIPTDEDEGMKAATYGKDCFDREITTSDFVNVEFNVGTEKFKEEAIVLYVSRTKEGKPTGISLHIHSGRYKGDVKNFDCPLKSGEKITRTSLTAKEGADLIAKSVKGDAFITKGLPTMIGSAESSERIRKLSTLKRMGTTIESRVKEIEDSFIAEAKAKGRKSVEQKELTKMIKQILKEYYPSTKFSVRGDTYSMGASIDVRWSMGPTNKEVSDKVRKYHNKGFDGSTDSSYYIDVPWDTDSVHAQREIPEVEFFKKASELAGKPIKSWSDVRETKVDGRDLSELVNAFSFPS